VGDFGKQLGAVTVYRVVTDMKSSRGGHEVGGGPHGQEDVKGSRQKHGGCTGC
jgi:hypothetical protein